MPPSQALLAENKPSKEPVKESIDAMRKRYEYLMTARLRLRDLQDAWITMDAGFDMHYRLQALRERTRALARMTTPRADLDAAEAALSFADGDSAVASLKLGIFFEVACGCSLALGRADASPSEMFTIQSLVFAVFFGTVAIVCGCRALFERARHGPYVMLAPDHPLRVARDEAQKKYDNATDVRFKELCAENEAWLKLKTRAMAAVRNSATRSSDAAVADAIAVDALATDVVDVEDASTFA